MASWISATQQAIQSAQHNHEKIFVCGNQTLKACYPDFIGEELSTRDYRGIIQIDSGELLLEAKAGTSLLEIKQALDEKDLMLPFDPVQVNEKSTIGGSIAANLSGSRQRLKISDCLLGVSIIDGKGQYLEFGGRVIKNVTGFNVSALMVSSYGKLGILCDLKLRVLPKAKVAISLRTEIEADRARYWYQNLMQKQNPIVTGLIENQTLTLAIETSPKTIQHWKNHLGKNFAFEEVDFDWHQLNKKAFELSKQNTISQLRVNPISANVENTLYEYGGGEVRVIEGLIDEMAENHQLSNKSVKILSTDNELKISQERTLTEMEKRIKEVFDPNWLFNDLKTISHNQQQ